jgi:hypothetical protein
MLMLFSNYKRLVVRKIRHIPRKIQRRDYRTITENGSHGCSMR